MNNQAVLIAAEKRTRQHLRVNDMGRNFHHKSTLGFRAQALIGVTIVTHGSILVSW